MAGCRWAARSKIGAVPRRCYRRHRTRRFTRVSEASPHAGNDEWKQHGRVTDLQARTKRGKCEYRLQKTMPVKGRTGKNGYECYRAGRNKGPKP